MDIYILSAIGFLASCLLLFFKQPLFISEVYLDVESQSAKTKIDIRKLGLWIAILATFYFFLAITVKKYTTQ